MVFRLKRNCQLKCVGLSQLLVLVACVTMAGAVDLPVRRAAPGDTHLIGTIEPDVIEVCAHVPGFIARLGPDPRGTSDPQFAGKAVDFTTPVEAGALLAQLDDGPFRVRVAQAEAAVQRAEAQIEGGQRQGGDCAGQARRFQIARQSWNR